tara:strand:- start:182 stop:454 length:273 start_codon:yes stop_codon:yes gene_type:complete
MKTILITFLLSVTFISCNNSKSGFSQEFKDNFTRECVKNAKVNLSNSEAERYCNCVLGVVMTKYGSDSEADEKMLDMSMNDVMELVKPCQ